MLVEPCDHRIPGKGVGLIVVGEENGASRADGQQDDANRSGAGVRRWEKHARTVRASSEGLKRRQAARDACRQMWRDVV